MGCPRNLVDSELILGRLSNLGYKIVEDIQGCDVAIINTCAFIEDAKREAIDTILKASALKKEGLIKKIVVCGCLGQRYGAQLKREMPEVDAILGIDNFKNIEDALVSILENKRFIKISPPDTLYSDKDPRIQITPPHYAYVKIAEGCDNRCSYCAIYKIRGNFRSRSIGSILSEIRNLTKKVRLSELNIIAQDTTSYGIDNYGKFKLSLLLSKISRQRRAHWIRLLYTHPGHFTDELIEVIAQDPAICKYIDLPIQHINDKILKRMNRRINRRRIEALIEKIRREIPAVSLRTSVIVGFPGETQRDFKELLDFIRDIKFERLGAFIYSREEVTPANRFKNHISEKIKRERFDELMKLQQEVSKEVNAKFMHTRLEVLIESGERGNYIGRTQYDAPEVDGEVYVHSKRALKPGDFVGVEITDTLEYDLVGVAGEK